MPSKIRQASLDIADEFIARAVDMTAASGQIQRQMVRLFEDLEADLIARVSAVQWSKHTTAYQKKRLKKLLSEVSEILASYYGTARTEARAALATIAAAEASHSVSVLVSAAATIEFNGRIVTPARVASIADTGLIEGLPYADWWGRQRAGLRSRFEQQMALGLLASETNSQLIKRVREMVGGNRHLATGLVRTAQIGVSSDARRLVASQNNDIVRGLVQLSTLDTRTSRICWAYAGKKWRFPDMTPVGHALPYVSGVPRHWMCRSAETFWMVGDAGEIPIEASFEPWLKRQEAESPGFIAESYGPTVASLYKSGRIKAVDLVDRSGDQRTVAELVELSERRMARRRAARGQEAA